MKAWEKNIRKVTPYVPGEQPKVDGIIKLNTNENPYGPSKRVEEIKYDMDNLRKYPDPKIELLVDAIAEYHGLTSDKVFVGVGSDDVIAMAFMTYFNSDKPILFPDITYSFYDVWADMLHIPYERVPLNSDFRIVKEDYIGRECGGIIFPNPNAPTGILESVDFIEEIVKANPDVIVIIDEAYIDFGGETVLPLIDKYDNLVITRTFSKSRSMAGLRIGYAMANPVLIKYLNDVKYSFNSYTLNSLSIILGTESVKDDAYFKETVQKVINTREWFTEEAKKLGFRVLPSSSNFVFAEHEKLSGNEIFEYLKANKIYVRHFSSPRIDNFLRISIGTDEEMKALVNCLRQQIEAL